jgi:voltage-gated potassium channel
MPTAQPRKLPRKLRRPARNAFAIPRGIRSRPRPLTRIESSAQVSATLFLILRRMRVPLITLIMMYTISVFGLTLIPGQDVNGQPYRMGFFDAFYFMSYTATTIGFGEIPHPFTYAQRLWVLVTIYLTVIGWAYALASLFTLVQDKAFRQALRLQRFSRSVARLSEPFLLLAGYGKTGELLARSFDGLNRQMVIIDASESRIEELGMDTYQVDIPALAADARNPHHLAAAGLHHPLCEGVLAMTDDDEVNLAVTMAAALLRPDVAVVARTVSRVVADRMRAFGTPTVVNPFDRFGNHLRIALRAPASYQLLEWLEAGPGAPLPERGQPPVDGRWVVCGYGRFGREVIADLRAEGLLVTVIESSAAPVGTDGTELEGVRVVTGDASEPGILSRAGIEDAVAFIAGTDNDTTNLSLLAAARRLNPALFLAARQNARVNAPLFTAMHVDALLIPAEVVAHEVYAQLSTPLLWRFVQDMPAKGDAWAADVVARLQGHCGSNLQSLWRLQLIEDEAPALLGWLRSGEARIGDLLRDPDDRDRELPAVCLLVIRGDEAMLLPEKDFVVQLGDALLFAGDAAARRSLIITTLLDAAAEYVFYDRHIPSSWVWRQFTRKRALTAAGR